MWLSLPRRGHACAGRGGTQDTFNVPDDWRGHQLSSYVQSHLPSVRPYRSAARPNERHSGQGYPQVNRRAANKLTGRARLSQTKNKK